jgi:hypothetical protein
LPAEISPQWLVKKAANAAMAEACLFPCSNELARVFQPLTPHIVF